MPDARQSQASTPQASAHQPTWVTALTSKAPALQSASATGASEAQAATPQASVSQNATSATVPQQQQNLVETPKPESQPSTALVTDHADGDPDDPLVIDEDMDAQSETGSVKRLWSSSTPYSTDEEDDRTPVNSPSKKKSGKRGGRGSKPKSIKHT